MFALAFDTADLHLALTLLVLVAAITLFVTEKLAPDLTALLALLALLLFGVLTPAQAFAGFSHPAVVSVAAVLVLSAGIERTGALGFVARRVLTPLGKSEWMLTAVVMLAIAVLSAFLNNTAAVAIFIPVVLEACRRTGASPGRVLMPMAFAATFGGMCTLMGTSTNLVVHEYARAHGLPGYTMFELASVGLPIAGIAFVYLLFGARFMLPKNRVVEDDLARAGDYVAELVIKAGSTWIGTKISAKTLSRDHDLELFALSRGTDVIDVTDAGVALAEGDALRVRGRLEDVLKLSARGGIELHKPHDHEQIVKQVDTDAERNAVGASADPETKSAAPLAAKLDPMAAPKADPKIETQAPRLAEVVLLPGNDLVGRTLKESEFAQTFGALVVALRRRGRAFGRPSTTRLRTGDVLVLEGSNEALTRLSRAHGFLVVGTPTPPEVRHEKIFIAVGTLVAVITAVAFGWMSIVAAATAGCALLMLTGCLKPREAYEALDLSVVFLLAGALAIGTALEVTGVPERLATILASVGGGSNPLYVLAGFFLIAVLLSEFMSNSGAATLLCPIALTVAERLGIAPMTLLAAVTFGCSAAFAMPIGYQTSLMIYGPGGYRFKDFVRVGLLLDVLVAVVALALIPKFWPLLAP
ncbi:MAG: SLC13 family permease [Planctomycetota bacterium]|nr:SLC13 family permease [Planctomycetota bacterium]